MVLNGSNVHQSKAELTQQVRIAFALSDQLTFLKYKWHEFSFTTKIYHSPTRI